MVFTFFSPGIESKIKLYWGPWMNGKNEKYIEISNFMIFPVFC